MTMTTLFSALAWLSSMATGTVLAAPPPLDDAALAKIVDRRIAGDRTGACLAVALIDGDAVARAFRCARAEDAGRIDAASAFEIGSLSKPMTSTLLARLIVEGKARLDDPLADYLPPGSEVPRFQGQPIRLRHLVTHTAGLPALPASIAAADPQDPYAAVSADVLLRDLAGTRLQTAPGSVHAYSNFGGMLLSLAVARRSGIDLESALSQHLFAPLGMKRAFVRDKRNGARPAQGHHASGKPAQAWHFAPELAGVGGVHATLDDMVRFVQAEVGVLSTPLDAALALGRRPVEVAAEPRTAMNWMLTPLNGVTWHAHEGGTGGFSSFVAFQVERRRGVVILADTAMTDLGGLGSLGLHLADSRVPLGKPRREAKAPPALLDGLSGRYRLDSGLAMELRRDGDALIGQAAGQNAFRLKYDDAGDFYPTEIDARLTPMRGSDGRYAFSWHQGGGVLGAMRVDADGAVRAAPSAEQLQAYAGRYRLAPAFDLSVRALGGALHARASGQEEFALQALGDDRFQAAAFGIEIRFTRNAAGQVDALELHQAGRVVSGRRQQ